MKQYLLMGCIMGSLALSGCSGYFWGGAAAGALGAGAAYEIQAKRQMDQLEEDYKNEKINKKEYESRKQQIERGSIIY
jgi:osmotically-inducible protein OsmY